MQSADMTKEILIFFSSANHEQQAIKIRKIWLIERKILFLHDKNN